MNTQITTTTGSTLAVTKQQDFWSAQQLAALRQIGVENAPNADLAVFLNYAQRTGLDPFARQIYMIGRRSKAGNDWITKWTIQASIDGLRIVAERSGDYAGQVGPEFCGPDGIWRDVWVGSEPPVATRIGVLRHGFNAPLFAVAYWDEFVQTDRDGNPSAMWKSKPKLMLAKCAEALALRKAFPNDLAGLYTADEMGNPETQLAVQPVKPVEPVVEIVGEIVSEPGTVVQDQSLITAPQIKLAQTLFSKLGYKQEGRHAIIQNLFNREITHINQLTKSEAIILIDNLKETAQLEAIGE
jgi:phage recombination protein Bet